MNINIDPHDIEALIAFIHAKEDPTKIENFIRKWIYDPEKNNTKDN